MVFYPKNFGLIWIALSQFILFLANFGLLRLLTNSMSVYSFGLYSLCMTIVLFTRQILYDPVSTVLARNYAGSKCEIHDSAIYFGVARFLNDKYFIALGALAVAMAILGLISGKTQEATIIVFGTLFLCSIGAQGLYFNLLNMVPARGSAAIFSIIDSVLKLFAVYLVFLIVGNDVTSVIVAISISCFFVFFLLRSFVGFRFLSVPIDACSRSRWVGSSLNMALPLVIPAILGSFRSVADRWILAGYIGVDDLAMYTVLLQIGYMPMLLIFGVVQTYIAPTVYAMCSGERAGNNVALLRYLLKVVGLIAAFTALFCVVAFAFSGFLFGFIVGSNYSGVAKYLPIFIVSGSLTVVGNIFYLALLGGLETRVVGNMLSVGVVVNLCISFALISWLGLEGAMYAMFFNGFVILVYYFLVFWRQVFRFERRLM